MLRELLIIWCIIFGGIKVIFLLMSAVSSLPARLKLLKGDMGLALPFGVSSAPCIQYTRRAG